MTWLPLLPLLLVGLLCLAVIVWKYRKDTRRNRRVSRSAWYSRNAHRSFWSVDNRGKTECR